MKFKGVLCACALYTAMSIVVSAHADDGLSKVIRDEVKVRPLKRVLTELNRAASRFDNNPTQEALTNFRLHLKRTVGLLNNTEVTLQALGDALKDASGKQDVGDGSNQADGKEGEVRAKLLVIPSPTGSPTAAPSSTRPRRPVLGSIDYNW